MHQLSDLRFCRDVLVQRQQSDKWQGWFWGIRRKVIEFWIARLERNNKPGQTVPDLTTEEQQAVRSSHPLLAARPIVSGSVLKMDSL